MILLSKADITRVFSMGQAIEAAEETFRRFSAGEVEVPLRTAISAKEQEGTFLFMPAYSPAMGAASLKVVDIFPNNPKQGIPSTTSQLLLIDGKTGVPAAMLDGTYVTQLRTGAATGAALKHLAKKTCRKGALFGSGSQAAAQLHAMLEARPLEEVAVFSPNKAHCTAFAEEMSRLLGAYPTRIYPAGSAEKATRDADILVAATTARTPVFESAWVKPGATVSGVGSFLPEMQELPAELLLRASGIYFDSREAVLAEAGDFIQPLQQGILTEDAFTGDLGQLLLGQIPGRHNDEEIIVFKSVGIGAQDLVAAQAIYAAARAYPEPVGLRWP